MERQHDHAELFLNDELVGQVEVRGIEASWSFGDFQPNDAFAQFAPVFGIWSLLMHDETDGRVHESTADELRKAEMEIDRLKARLHFVATDQWLQAAQLNIDGTLIEWKQY